MLGCVFVHLIDKAIVYLIAKPQLLCLCNLPSLSILLIRTKQLLVVLTSKGFLIGFFCSERREKSYHCILVVLDEMSCYHCALLGVFSNT